MGNNAKNGIRHTIEFKHEVCQFYEHHSQFETMAKYGISSRSIWIWRTKLGYRNKHIGYNNHTEMLQLTATKRERRNFMMVKTENGKLKAKVADLEYKLSAMELVVTSTLKGLGAEIESTLEAFKL